MRPLGWLIALPLVAGCLGSATDDGGTTLDPDASADDEDLASTDDALSVFYLNDPDLISVSGEGLVQLNVSTNTSLRISAVSPGTSIGAKWLLTWPQGAWTNATACAAWPKEVRLRHFANGYDSLTGWSLEPGNHTFLAYGATLDNVTLAFNATEPPPLRRNNGTQPPFIVRGLEADVRLEADGTPYRASFNKTLPVTGRALLLASFAFTASGSVAPLEVKQKIEHDSFLCDDDAYALTNPTPTGPFGYRSHVHVMQPSAGPVSWSGHVRAQSALFPQVATEGDLVLLG